MEYEQSFFRVLSQYAGGASAIVKNPLTEHVPGFKYSSLFRPESLIGTSDKANISTNRAKFFSGFCAGARAVGETPALVPHYGRNLLFLFKYCLFVCNLVGLIELWAPDKETMPIPTCQCYLLL